MEFEQLKKEVATYVEEKKPFMIGQIAAEFKVTELEATKAMPKTIVSLADKDEFENIWDALVEWEKCLFLVQHLGSVFEIVSKLNKGTHGHGYFNLNGEGPIHGHLKVDDISNIAFVSMPMKDSTSNSVIFFNEEGEVKFAIYIGRNADRQLIPAALDSFLNLKNKYAE